MSRLKNPLDLDILAEALTLLSRPLCIEARVEEGDSGSDMLLLLPGPPLDPRVKSDAIPPWMACKDESVAVKTGSLEPSPMSATGESGGL